MTSHEIVEEYMFNASLGFSSAILVAAKTLEKDGVIKPSHFKDSKEEFISSLTSSFKGHMNKMIEQVEDEKIKNFVGKWHESLTNRITETTTTILSAKVHQVNLNEIKDAAEQIFNDYGHYMHSDLQ